MALSADGNTAIVGGPSDDGTTGATWVFVRRGGIWSQQGDKLVGASLDIDGEVLRVPLGVFGMIAPFNFPLMVPFWFFPYALATGNTYVVKPSEQVPLSMTRLAELVDQCGFPPGVFNVVHGDKRAAEALLESPDVAGISFVGTSRVGRIIAARCAGVARSRIWRSLLRKLIATLERADPG